VTKTVTLYIQTEKKTTKKLEGRLKGTAKICNDAKLSNNVAFDQILKITEIDTLIGETEKSSQKPKFTKNRVAVISAKNHKR